MVSLVNSGWRFEASSDAAGRFATWEVRHRPGEREIGDHDLGLVEEAWRAAVRRVAWSGMDIPASPTDSAAGSLFVASGEARHVGGTITIAVERFELAAGATVALRGPSGVGKSTLFRGWFGLAPYDVHWIGERRFAGARWPVEVEAHRALLRERVCVVPQDVRAAFDPLRPVGQQVRAAASRSDVGAALADLAIEDGERLLRRYPHELSGGQAQAMALAIAMSRGPALVVADEPSLGLDPRRVDELIERLHTLRAQRGSALLLTSHDDAFLRALQVDASWTIDALRRLRRDGAPLAPLGHAFERPRTAPDGSRDEEEPLITLDGVGYSRGTRFRLAPVCLRLARGDSLAIIGPIGVGKTTLARILTGELLPSCGTLRRSAEAARPRAVQLLSQDAHASITPGRSVRSLLRETAVPDFDARAEAAALGLAPPILDRSAAELSGGERRRVALLRALSVRPRVLILDEPTADLDADTARDVVGAVLACQQRHDLATLWITHDLELARAVSARIVELLPGARC